MSQTNLKPTRSREAVIEAGPDEAATNKIPVALTAEEVAQRADVTVDTLNRWIKAGAIPQYQGAWTPAASAHARIVAQLRRGGQTVEEIALAARDGRLALGAADKIFAAETSTFTLREAAERAEMEYGLAERIWVTLGFSLASKDNISEIDVAALVRVAEVLRAGVPLTALLQVIRVAAKAFADIADAEARLMRMFVHEPLLQEGADSGRIAEVMGGMIEAVIPHMSPLLDYMHTRYLQQHTEQIQIENVQGDAVLGTGGMTDVAVCFVDIAGFTRYTEQAGVEKAFEQAELLRNRIETTLPETARLIKLTGDGAMIVGAEATDLVRWATELAGAGDMPFGLRLGLHCGEALFRDGDYFGGAINMAARVLNRADAGEALATVSLRDLLRRRASTGIRFVSIGRVRLKGFDEPIELFRVELREDD